MSFISTLLDRSHTTPCDDAFIFVDYDTQGGDQVNKITWRELNAKIVAVSAYLENHDVHAQPQRVAAISAPQGLDYVVGFLGALCAGWIPVPLPEPRGSLQDKRTVLALTDCAADVVLTTSSAEEPIRDLMGAHGLNVTMPIIPLDTLAESCAPPSAGSGWADYKPAEQGCYLQYTSGSTGRPRGAVISLDNAVANLEQIRRSFFRDEDGSTNFPGSTVSWLPLYHDMGLVTGILIPIFCGCPSVLMSSASFIRRPVRWIQLLAQRPAPFTAAPNFAFDLAVNKVAESDMKGLDLAHVSTIVNGSERVRPNTIEKFLDRFCPYNLNPAAVKPAYGMAEAVVYVATTRPRSAPVFTEFDTQSLARGRAELKNDDTECTTRLMRYHCSGNEPLIRIVDPDSNTELAPGRIGEIWVNGKNTSAGYYKADGVSNRDRFHAGIREVSAGMPKSPWMRTGDLGFLLGEDFYIVGRIKDLIIQDGVNHYPEDIENTVNQFTGGRVAAFSIPDDSGERLVVVAEVKTENAADESSELSSMSKQVRAAISRLHGLRLSDFLLVPPGALPRTTSGKISRAACSRLYRADEFGRIEVKQ
ncbi:Putative AMP-binding protein [Mycobacterium canetti]|uniref:AMP-binding protein n=1 Tax=Mycobacterium canetti TaxID=78331 RepID=UPI002D79B07B|nr:AMP-binding protein [Mycobacterium canetti]WRO40427.1 Putative AMP-binding protein [Mycobacterium canetti]